MDNADKGKQRPRLQILAYPEVCERCGRAATVLYLWNNRWLCKTCLKEEQQEWGLVSGRPSATTYKVIYQKKEGLLSSLMNSILERIGLRKRSEVKTAETVISKARKERSKYGAGVAFRYARPFTEKLKEKPKKNPEAEGIIKKISKKPKKQK